MPNKLLSSEKFPDHVLLLLFFFPFRSEKQSLSGCPLLYQNKLQEQGVQDVVNRKKINFEPYGDLADQAFSQFNMNSTIKTHTAKLKIMKRQRQSIPMKMIQKIQKQTKLLQFATLCHKYYQMIESQKA